MKKFKIEIFIVTLLFLFILYIIDIYCKKNIETFISNNNTTKIDKPGWIPFAEHPDQLITNLISDNQYIYGWNKNHIWKRFIYSKEHIPWNKMRLPRFDRENDIIKQCVIYNNTLYILKVNESNKNYIIKYKEAEPTVFGRRRRRPRWRIIDAQNIVHFDIAKVSNVDKIYGLETYRSSVDAKKRVIFKNLENNNPGWSRFAPGLDSGNKYVIYFKVDSDTQKLYAIMNNNCVETFNLDRQAIQKVSARIPFDDSGVNKWHRCAKEGEKCNYTGSAIHVGMFDFDTRDKSSGDKEILEWKDITNNLNNLSVILTDRKYKWRDTIQDGGFTCDKEKTFLRLPTPWHGTWRSNGWVDTSSFYENLKKVPQIIKKNNRWLWNYKRWTGREEPEPWNFSEPATCYVYGNNVIKEGCQTEDGEITNPRIISVGEDIDANSLNESNNLQCPTVYTDRYARTSDSYDLQNGCRMKKIYLHGDRIYGINRDGQLKFIKKDNNYNDQDLNNSWQNVYEHKDYPKNFLDILIINTLVKYNDGINNNNVTKKMTLVHAIEGNVNNNIATINHTMKRIISE